MPNGYDDIALVEDAIEVQAAWSRFSRQFKLPSFEGIEELVEGELRLRLLEDPTDAELAYRVLTKLEAVRREKPLDGVEVLRQVAACAAVALDGAADRLFDDNGVVDGKGASDDPVEHLLRADAQARADENLANVERLPRRLQLIEARDLVRQRQEARQSGTTLKPLGATSVPVAFALKDSKNADLGIVAWLTTEVLPDGEGKIFADRRQMPLLRMMKGFAEAPDRALEWAMTAFDGVGQVNARWSVEIIKSPEPELEKRAPFRGPSAFAAFAFALGQALARSDGVKAKDGKLAEAFAAIDPKKVAFSAGYGALETPPGTLVRVGDIVTKARELRAALLELQVLVVAEGQDNLEALRGTRPKPLPCADLEEAVLKLADNPAVRLPSTPAVQLLSTPAVQLPSTPAVQLPSKTPTMVALAVIAALVAGGVGIGMFLMRGASAKSPRTLAQVPAAPVPPILAAKDPAVSSSVSPPPRTSEPAQAPPIGQARRGGKRPRPRPTVIFDTYCRPDASSLERMLGDACNPETRCHIERSSNDFVIPDACRCAKPPELMTALSVHFATKRCQRITLKLAR
jgi:hypothetical protein